ncbi:copper resistance CopC family protein [Micromonospora echinospora]|uniref:copper resistance CopC family protein n=1 Tax=Micromonospora echinospora TaxID=1877 RepID=UPI003A8A2C7C
MRLSASALVGVLVTAVALFLTPASPAAAHNTLQEATPARNARVTTPPGEITLRFMQKLDPDLTTITLTDDTGQEMPTGEVTVTGPTGTIAIDEPIANGTYTVAYRVVSADGHPVRGSYRFTVADPTRTAGPTEAASPSVLPTTAESPTATATPSPAASDSTDDGPDTVVMVGAALLGVLALAGLALMLRRRRHNAA